MKLKTKEARTLYKAACLIDTPKKWAQGLRSYMARLDERAPTCALGAVERAIGTDNAHWADAWPRRLSGGFDSGIWTSPSEFNDAPDTTHGDVMTLFALAIVLAEEGAES